MPTPALDPWGHSVPPFPDPSEIPVDGIWTGFGASLLSLVDATEFTEGTRIWVASVGRWFRLARASALATSGVGDTEVVNAASPAGAQWLSADGDANLFFLSKRFWAVDPSNLSGLASDENPGWGTSVANAELLPLRTLEEYNRRMFGRYGSTTDVISLMSSDSDTPRLTNVWSENGNDYPVILGKRVQFGADYTVSAYATAVPDSNTGFLLSATGIGTAGNVGKLVTNAAVTKWAFVQSSTGANQVRLTQPINFDPVSYSGTYDPVDFSVGELVRVWALPTLSQWPWTDNIIYPGVADCEIKGFFSNPSFDVGLFTSSAPQITRCIINGVGHQGGCQGSYIGCQFAKTESNLSSSFSMAIAACGVRGVQLLFTTGVVLLTANLDIEAGQLLISDECAVLCNDPTSSISMFNCTATAISSNSGSFKVYNPSTKIYGSGNTGLLYSAPVGTSSKFSKTATVVTSSANKVSLAGIGHVLADIPISDTATLSVIND